MTKKEFTYALKRGLGRGIIAAKNDPEKYKEIVLGACQKCLAFDPQCEGTRAWYMHELISCYEDKAVFLQVICEKFLKQKSTGGWNIQYFSELLCYFADDGFNEAKAALWEKYDQLYQALRSRKRAPQGFFHERDDFGMLCVTLSYEFDSYLRIAKDIGALYLTKSFYDGFDFAWFYGHGEEKKYNRRLQAKAKQSAELQCYLEMQWMWEKTWREQMEHRSHKNLSEYTGRRLSVLLAKENKETIEAYANQYLEAKGVEERINALQAFSNCPFPLDPAPVIKDAQSDVVALKEAALEALTNIRHPSVREFALQVLGSDFKNGFPMFVKNYQAKDRGLLEDIVKLILANHEAFEVHNTYAIILELFRKDSGISNPPKSVLPILYETTPCSVCREEMVSLMGKYRMLSPDVLEECLYDSNEEIRKYAQKRLGRIVSSCRGVFLLTTPA